MNSLSSATDSYKTFDISSPTESVKPESVKPEIDQEPSKNASCQDKMAAIGKAVLSPFVYCGSKIGSLTGVSDLVQGIQLNRAGNIAQGAKKLDDALRKIIVTSVVSLNIYFWLIRSLKEPTDYMKFGEVVDTCNVLQKFEKQSYNECMQRHAKLVLWDATKNYRDAQGNLNINQDRDLFSIIHSYVADLQSKANKDNHSLKEWRLVATWAGLQTVVALDKGNQENTKTAEQEKQPVA